MTDSFVFLSGSFPDADEEQWLAVVTQALKGRSPDSLEQTTTDGLTLKPLYREADWPSARNPLGQPGAAPFLRGNAPLRDGFLPWDIRQTFTHPDPAVTHGEILRDLERGVSGLELTIDPTGMQGCSIADPETLEAVLKGVEATIATVALSPVGPVASYGLEAAALLAQWGNRQKAPADLKLAFNLCPLSALARLGILEESLDSAFRRTAGLAEHLSGCFRQASLFRIDARPVHETGGSDAQELAALIADGIDTLRRLEAAGFAIETAAPALLFTISVDANYGVGIAKIRAARRLWANCLAALDLPAMPMQVQAVSSRRMLTRHDPWVNLLRNTAACFAGGVGGADCVTLHAFTDALGVPEELGRRTARNTQIIAQEESGLGRVADPAGGAWFMESHADALARAAWTLFQEIEAEGGYGASLEAGHFQARIAVTRKALQKDIARRKLPLTGVTEFAQLAETPAPVTDLSGWTGGQNAFNMTLPQNLPMPDGETLASPLVEIRLAAPFEHLRDHARARAQATGKHPAIFVATLGPVAEHTARADFAVNFFAVGGIQAKFAQVPPQSVAELVAAFKASGAALAILCGSDARYADEASAAARTLKAAGVQRLYLAGKPSDHHQAWAEAGIDSYIHLRMDVVAALELAHAELGISG